MLSEWKAAVLRHAPPPADVLHAGQLYLGPAAGAAAVVFAFVLLVLGRRSALAAGSLAVVVGIAVANYRNPLVPWWPEGKGWHWLPILFVVAQFDALFARVPSVPLWGGWRLRLGIGFLTALVIVPAGLHVAWPAYVESWPYLFQGRAWPLIAFTLAVALGWAGSEAAARQAPGGSVGLGLAMSLFGASLVILHAPWASFAELITYPAAALLGVAVVALFCKVDVGGALPGIAVVLPAMLLLTFDQTAEYTKVPWYAFLLAALPPLTIGLLAIPPMNRLTGLWRGVMFWVLCLGPTVAAVTLTVWKESLTAGDEW